MEKNQIITLQIEDMGANGEGIGKVDGYPLFVKDAVVGDTAEVIVTKLGKSYGFGHLKEVITPSPYRIQARCPAAVTCGGCQLQALSYERQLLYKEQKVYQNLMRIGGFSKELLDAAKEPIIGMEEPWHYRNKEQFPVGTDKDGKLITGFYAGRSHRIVPISDCPLGMPENSRILQMVLTYMEENHIPAYDEVTGKGIVRHVVTRFGKKTGEWMVALVVNAEDKSPLKSISKLLVELIKIPGMTSICLCPNTKMTNVILGDSYQVLWGKDYIEDRIGDITYAISPLSFYQVNPIQTERLYNTALSYAQLTGEEHVWDLYCGIGTISLFLARNAASVKGIEVVPAAVRNARANAERNGISNASFFEGRAEELLPKFVQNADEKADVIVVDPPRKGCDEKLLATMLNLNPSRIVYVSCDSATLARDLKYLTAGGYHLEKYRPHDLFCQTCHVETVVLLSRKDA